LNNQHGVFVLRIFSGQRPVENNKIPTKYR